MKGYPVGSIVTLQNCEYFPELNGAEATILAPLSQVETHNQGKILAYKTDLVHNEMSVYPKHYQVRLKQLPPDEQVVKFLNKLLQPCGIDIKENV